jgi:hypothetical protein
MEQPKLPATIDQSEPPKLGRNGNSLTPTSGKERGPLNRKVRAAIERMLWDGLEMDEAAKVVGITTRRLRTALEKPIVLAHLKAQRKVLCATELPANIRRLKAIRDAAENMPAVHAIRDLEQIAADETIRSDARVQERPGMVIVVVPAPQPLKPHQQIIDAQPLQTDE